MWKLIFVQIMDVRDLKIETASVDVAIDKVCPLRYQTEGI
jgi:hypothetical protein